MSFINLVIFDKDGTLLDLQSTWSNRIESFTQRLRANYSSIEDKEIDAIYQVIGYDSTTKKIKDNGYLASYPISVIKEQYMILFGHLTNFSNVFDVEWTQISQVAPDTLNNVQLRPLMLELKKRNVKIAICTTDDRKGTISDLTLTGIIDLIDVIVCGDDGRGKKPEPEMITYICKYTGIPVNETLMIGDSSNDLKMGRSANCKAVVWISKEEITNSIRPLCDSVITDIYQLPTAIDMITVSRDRIYINMVADLFHAGHVAILEKAKRLGKTLIVGIHSDKTVESYKRTPILTMSERIAVVKACKYVDEVIPDSPLFISEEFITSNKIDTVVAGDDNLEYKLNTQCRIPWELMKLAILPYTPNISTTDIISRIQSSK
jgi:HAD superfamily hydrolase (TIGR01509 family)